MEARWHEAIRLCRQRASRLRGVQLVEELVKVDPGSAHCERALNEALMGSVRELCLSALFSPDPGPQETRAFFECQVKLFSLLVRHGVTRETVNNLELFLTQLLNLGVHMSPSEELWTECIRGTIGKIPTGMLPEPMSIRVVELMTSEALGQRQRKALEDILFGSATTDVAPKKSVKKRPREEDGAADQEQEIPASDDADGAGFDQKVTPGTFNAGGARGDQHEIPGGGKDSDKGHGNDSLDDGMRFTTGGHLMSGNGGGMNQKEPVPKPFCSRVDGDDSSNNGMRFTKGGRQLSDNGGGVHQKDPVPKSCGVWGDGDSSDDGMRFTKGGHHLSNNGGGVHKKEPIPKPFGMEAVEKEILQWDVTNLASVHPRPHLVDEVPDRFHSVQEYCQTFKDLLLEEIHSKLHQEWEELKDRYYRLGSKSMIVKKTHQVSDGLYTVALGYRPDGRTIYHPDDILLFSSNSIDFKYAIPKQRCTGIVKNVGTKPDGDGRVHLEVRVCMDGKAAESGQVGGSFLVQGITCKATAIASLTTEIRELSALSNLHLLPEDLLNQIMAPQLPDAAPESLSKVAHLPPKLSKKLEETFNLSQQKAIAGGIAGKGRFTLVQGPPGTGKTKVTAGLLSGLLETAYRINPRITYTRDSEDGPGKLSKGRKRHLREVRESHSRVRLLVCAQSNGAVDELIARVTGGAIFDANGASRMPKIVRFGRLDATSSCAAPYHIDILCNQRLATDERTAYAYETTMNLQEKIAAAKDTLYKIREELKRAQRSYRRGSGGWSIDELNNKKRKLEDAIDEMSSDLESNQQILDRAKRGLKAQILREAELVFTTLSSSGGELASLCNNKARTKQVTFEALIVDEACQATEPAILTPLGLLDFKGKVLLVGDPRQLPPTVVSPVAAQKKFGQSMFERLESTGHPVEMLTTQYRMHPCIARFPSKTFYSSMLDDGVNEAERRAPFHREPHFAPFLFYDCESGWESRSRRSIENKKEAELVAKLFADLKTQYRESVGNVAIIAPYRAQVERIKTALQDESRLSADGKINLAELNVEVATVDSFQGREADVVIMSMVRAQNCASGLANLGFLEDTKRMNVAITRAKRALWVVGHQKTLSSSVWWREFIHHAEESGAKITVPNSSSQ